MESKAKYKHERVSTTTVKTMGEKKATESMKSYTRYLFEAIDGSLKLTNLFRKFGINETQKLMHVYLLC